MRRNNTLFTLGSVSAIPLVAGAFLAFIAFIGAYTIPLITTEKTDFYMAPKAGVHPIGETFVVALKVKSSVPVNVFSGEISFDNEVISVESIDYNTSIANLWAERPWYSNGDGTLNFIGGTTARGGFTGDDTIVLVTFMTIAEGEAKIEISEVRILAHDGLGTEVTLNTPIDAIFTVDDTVLDSSTVVKKNNIDSSFTVVSELPNPDLNGDGRVNFKDVSIFMLNMLGNDPKYDLNGDGAVNSDDLSILLQS